MSARQRQPHWPWRRAPPITPKAPNVIGPAPPDVMPPPTHSSRHNGLVPRPSQYYYQPEYPPVSLQRRFVHPDHQMDDPDLDRFARKRPASAPNGDMDHYASREGDGNMPRLKRVRINWTNQENRVFFDTVKRSSTLDEQSLIRAIVANMGGKRNWTQCKGHFRNLVFVNKIMLDEKTKRWSVNPEAKRPIRTSSTSARGSEQSASESDARPGEKVENSKSQPLKSSSAAQQEEDQRIDKDDDEEEEESAEVEDVELGGGDDGGGNYVAPNEEEDAESPVEKRRGHDTTSDAKRRLTNDDVKTKNGTNGVDQARTRVLKGSRGDSKTSDRSPRALKGERRVGDIEDVARTMPHRKQLSALKVENGSKSFNSPSRRLKDMKRRNTADYRPTGYPEGRRYLKQ